MGSAPGLVFSTAVSGALGCPKKLLFAESVGWKLFAEAHCQQPSVGQHKGGGARNCLRAENREKSTVEER